MCRMSDFSVGEVPSSVLNANFRQETSSFHFQILWTRYCWISFFVVRQRCDLTLVGLADAFTCKIGTGQPLH